MTERPQMRFALSLFGCDEKASFRQRVQLGPQYVTIRQGCQVWDPFPKAGETADWTGPCVAGYAEGYGHDGLANGFGKLTEPNGLRYEGDVLFGLADGHGAVTLPDGTRYEGDFHLDLPDGQGRLVAAGAQGQLPRTFEGQWHGGCLTGSEPLICLQNKSSL